MGYNCCYSEINEDKIFVIGERVLATITRKSCFSSRVTMRYALCVCMRACVCVCVCVCGASDGRALAQLRNWNEEHKRGIRIRCRVTDRPDTRDSSSFKATSKVVTLSCTHCRLHPRVSTISIEQGETRRWVGNSG